MFCSKCGKQIPDDSRFCPECGASVPHADSPTVTEQTPTGQTSAVSGASGIASPSPSPDTSRVVSDTAQPGKVAVKKNTLIISIVVVVVIVLALVILLVVRPFGGKTDADQPNTTSTTSTTDKQSTGTSAKDKTDTSTKDTGSDAQIGKVVAGGDTFHGEGWTARIPDDWDGLYAVKTTNTKTGTAVSFYSVHNEQAGYGGNIVTILKTTDGSGEYPSFEALGSNGGSYYYALYPTDVQFDIDNADYTQEWKRMSAAVDGLVSSFEFE